MRRSVCYSSKNDVLILQRTKLKLIHSYFARRCPLSGLELDIERAAFIFVLGHVRAVDVFRTVTF